MDFRFSCPHCSNTIDASSSDAGKSVMCLRCFRLVQAPGTRPDDLIPAKATRPSESGDSGPPPLVDKPVMIRLAGRANPLWPPSCACCGGRSETLTTVTHKKFEDHVTRSSCHQVPSCRACRDHQETAGGAGYGYQFGFFVGLVFVAMVSYSVAQESGGDAVLSCMTIGVCGWVIFYMTLWYFVEKRNKESARGLMGGKCTGSTFVSFTREAAGVLDQGVVDTFWFTNREYARKFQHMNSNS